MPAEIDFPSGREPAQGVLGPQRGPFPRERNQKPKEEKPHVCFCVSCMPGIGIGLRNVKKKNADMMLQNKVVTRRGGAVASTDGRARSVYKEREKCGFCGHDWGRSEDNMASRSAPQASGDSEEQQLDGFTAGYRGRLCALPHGHDRRSVGVP